MKIVICILPDIFANGSTSPSSFKIIFLMCSLKRVFHTFLQDSVSGHWFFCTNRKRVCGF